jgi:hypothetical protein
VHPFQAYSQDSAGPRALAIAPPGRVADHHSTRERVRCRGRHGEVPSGAGPDRKPAPHRTEIRLAAATLRRENRTMTADGGPSRRVPDAGKGSRPRRGTGPARAQRRPCGTGFGRRCGGCGRRRADGGEGATRRMPDADQGRCALPEARVPLNRPGAGCGWMRPDASGSCPGNGSGCERSEGVSPRAPPSRAVSSDPDALASMSLQGSRGVGRVFAGHIARTARFARPAPRFYFPIQIVRESQPYLLGIRASAHIS